MLYYIYIYITRKVQECISYLLYMKIILPPNLGNTFLASLVVDPFCLPNTVTPQ